MPEETNIKRKSTTTLLILGVVVFVVATYFILRAITERPEPIGPIRELTEQDRQEFIKEQTVTDSSALNHEEKREFFEGPADPVLENNGASDEERQRFFED